MKLLTNIKPRRAGNVTVRNAAGQAFEFIKGDDGLLVCDIEDEALLARLLASGEFEPVLDADIDRAEALLKQAVGGDADEDPGGDDDGDDGDFTEMPNGGLPVEAETPPEPRPAAGKKRGKAATAG